MEKRRAGFLIAAALFILFSIERPTADIRIETHDIADVSPERIDAAIDIGLVAVKLLVTWTTDSVAR